MRFYLQLLLVIIVSLGTWFYLILRITTATSLQKRNPESDMKYPFYNVHIFYSVGFGNEKIDGKHSKWYYNTSERKFTGAYYPQLGLYSSNDVNVIDIHMKQIREARIGVVVLFWPEQHKNAPPLELILLYVQKYELKVTLCIRHYKNRNIINLFQILHEIFTKYSKLEVFYKVTVPERNKTLPLIYILDVQLISPTHWFSRLGYTSTHSIRETDLDALFIGTISDEMDEYVLVNSGFDGFFTFSAVYNSSYSSNWHHWPSIENFAKRHGLIFIPNVSPGYEYVQPKPTREPGQERLKYVDRGNGAYYQTSWARAIISRSKFVSINSFNDWIYGTQIEPAKPKNQYHDYGPEGPNYYLNLTKFWVTEFYKRYIIRMQS